MRTLSFEALKEYREISFSMRPELRLRSKEDALNFVNQRGFIYFWSITNVTMPSLWSAVAGDRPVASEHDDPGHVTWGWKDDMLGKRKWYYAKVLRKKATIISLDMVPYFYALSANYGSPEHDYLTLYEQGRLTQEAKLIYEILLYDGPLDTIALRRSAGMTNRSSDNRFNRAITDLQADFKILPVGITQSGGWRYAFLYDLVPHHFPELMEEAHMIHEQEARMKLVEYYFHSLGAAQLRDVKMIFQWEKKLVERAINSLVEAGVLKRGFEIKEYPGEWIADRDFVPESQSRHVI